jgi:hypothetical protein
MPVLECPMEPLKLAVALGVRRTGEGLLHLKQAHQFPEILRDELRAVVRDNPGMSVGI